jgi:hypothetical protein
VSLSSLQEPDEEEEAFAERSEWLHGQADSPSERHLVERLAVRYSTTPQQWRQGVLAFSFDSAFLDRLAGQRRGWTNKRKQRLLANIELTPRAQRLLRAQQVVGATISTQRVAWTYVAGLRGRSFPSPMPIRRTKEIRTMQNGNGHKPAGTWRVWTFTAYEPAGPATWWAYQTALRRSTPERRSDWSRRCSRKTRRKGCFQVSDPAERALSRALLQDDRHPIQRDRVDRPVIWVFDAWADSAQVKPVLGRVQCHRRRPDFDLYLHCGASA